jgi:DNA invertase Pin-like site-specific DNA recombinase
MQNLRKRPEPTPLDKPHLDLTTPLGRGFFAFLSAMAEDERGRVLKRANDGRVAAKAKRTRFGRKPKLTDHQQAEALKRLEAGESCWSIAKTIWPCTTPRSRVWRARRPAPRDCGADGPATLSEACGWRT